MKPANDMCVFWTAPNIKWSRRARPLVRICRNAVLSSDPAASVVVRWVFGGFQTGDERDDLLMNRLAGFGEDWLGLLESRV
jgi:hypothetical protein